ncbi:MAG: diphthine--ammonia ligase [Thermoprotei archaeon]
MVAISLFSRLGSEASGEGGRTNGVALYTGGKDSHFALIEALKLGIIVDLLVIVVPARSDSWMFHSINVEFSKLHADLIGVDKVVIRSGGVKETEVSEVLSELKKLNLRPRHKYLISGAVASKYQKERVDLIARELGLEHIAPLWGRDQKTLLLEEVKYLSFIVTAIQAYGLNMKWLGAVINEKNVKEFLSDLEEHSVSPVGEGGEFETYVISSKLFKKEGIYVESAELVKYPLHGLGYYVIKSARNNRPVL